MGNLKSQPKVEIFNGPIETGLRSFTLLTEAFPDRYDLQKLVFLDYLVVHSGDVGGPKSLHPATPMRSGETLVRRKLIERGLLLFMSRGLIERLYGPQGIDYGVADSASCFLDGFASSYAYALRERSSWVVASFGGRDNDELQKMFHENMESWGGRFEAMVIPEEEA